MAHAYDDDDDFDRPLDQRAYEEDDFEMDLQRDALASLTRTTAAALPEHGETSKLSSFHGGGPLAQDLKNRVPQVRGLEKQSAPGGRFDPDNYEFKRDGPLRISNDVEFRRRRLEEAESKEKERAAKLKAEAEKAVAVAKAAEKRVLGVQARIHDVTKEQRKRAYKSAKETAKHFVSKADARKQGELHSALETDPKKWTGKKLLSQTAPFFHFVGPPQKMYFLSRRGRLTSLR